MAVQPSNVLKSYFETGDKPTQSQFGDLIDTMFNSGTTDPIAGNPYKALMVDGTETGTFWGGATDLLTETTNRQTVFLAEDETFRNAMATDVAPIVQGIINSFSVGTALTLVYPAGIIRQSYVNTNNRSVNFVGQGTLGTTIIPTTNFTKAVFSINYAFSSVQGMTINDRSNTFDNPGFIINRNDTRALILMGEGGNTGAIKMLVQDVQMTGSRGQGIRYEGGPISTFNRVGITTSCAGGFYGTTQGGDTNHWKLIDVTFTRNFNFGMFMEDDNNGGGAGVFVDTKFYQSENYNLRLDGNANSGSLFVELSNGWSGNGLATRTAGSPVLQVIRDTMSSLTVGMYMDNPVPFGFPLGTYITAVNKDTGEVTMNFDATSSGSSSNYAFYTQRGMRNPSIWLGPNSYGNQLHVMGDALDPECWRDDSPAGSNQIALAYNSQQFTADMPQRKMRIFGGERNTNNPNTGLYFTTTATFTNGLPTITLTDTSVMNRIKYSNGTVSASGALSGNTSVVSVDQNTGVVTLAANAIATGVYQVIFRPNQRGGYLMRMLDDNVASMAVTGTNVSQRLYWTSRSSLYIGNTTSGSPVVNMFMKLDNESQSFTNGTAIMCLDKTVFPEGTTVSSFVNNGDGTFAVTLSKNALATRTGITFLATNTVGIRHIFQNTNDYDSNATATDAGVYLDEMFRTTTGEVRMLVPEEQDGLYRVSWDPPSIAAGVLQSYQNVTSNYITTDSDGKPLVNVALGDRIEVTCSRDLTNLDVWCRIQSANSVDIMVKNQGSTPIDLGSSNFYITHWPRT